MLHASWLWMCWSTNNQSQLTGECCHLLLLVMQSVVQRSRSNTAWFSWRYYCTWGTERLYIMIGAQAAQRCSFCCVFINDYGSISCVATLPATVPWAFLPLPYTHKSNLQRLHYQSLFLLPVNYFLFVEISLKWPNAYPIKFTSLLVVSGSWQ